MKGMSSECFFLFCVLTSELQIYLATCHRRFCAENSKAAVKESHQGNPHRMIARSKEKVKFKMTFTFPC